MSLVHLLTFINVLLLSTHVITDIAALAYQIILGIITIPIYCGLKGDKKWSFLLLSVVLHLIFSAIIIITFAFFVAEGSILLTTCFIELILNAFMAICFIIDLLINIVS